MMLRRAAATLATIGLSLLLCAGAQADARQDPNGYRFVSSALTVHENAGEAVITIVRGDTSIKGQVRYITIGAGGHCNGTPCSAVAPYDYTPVKARIDFPKGSRANRSSCRSSTTACSASTRRSRSRCSAL